MNDEEITLERTEDTDVALAVLDEGTSAGTVTSPSEDSEEEGSEREVTRTFQQEPINPEPLVF